MREWWGCSWPDTWMDLSQAFAASPQLRGTHRASFTWPCKRRKTQEFVFVYLRLPLSPVFLRSLYFFVSVPKVDDLTPWERPLVFKARKAELWDELQTGVFKRWSTFRCAFQSDGNCVTFAAAWQTRTRQYGDVVFLNVKLFWII